MDDLIRVEIAIVNGDKREWQWLGKLSSESLIRLTQVADTFSDKDTEA